MFDVRRSTFEWTVLLALLLNAGVGFAAEEPIPWHVKDAEIRLPVTVSIDPGRDIPDGDPRTMPPHVYLADLKPIESTGLSFDPASKGAEKAKGAATVPLKPEYKWFSFRALGDVSVFIDDKNVFKADSRAMGEYVQTRGPTIQTVVVPPDGKTLRIEADADYVRQAGFITRGPAVAQAQFCLPGLDPTSLIPLVYTLSGKRVGCRVLWAHPTEPMHILLDCSSGETQYMVYLVDRSKEVPRLDWTPRAGLIREARYLDHDDPAVTTLEGFQKLWDRADLIAEKSTQNEIFAGFIPFRPFHGDTPNYHDTPREAPLQLCRYTGFFHLPNTGEYEFSFKARSGGYLLFDNQLVAQDAEGKTEHGKPKSFKLKMEKGLHRLDCYQHGRDSHFYATLLWDLPGDQAYFRAGWNIHFGRAVFGSQYFSVWEALAKAAAGPPAHREKELFASFTWDYTTRGGVWRRWPSEWWGKYPAADVVQLSLAATLSQKREGAVFRWRFDDGHLVEGHKISHHFFMPGTRKVELDVLDGPDGQVIARAAGDIHVHIDWVWPADSESDYLQNAIAKRVEEFATVMPIAEVVSVYYWSLQHGWMENRTASGAALAKRLDEVLEEYPYPRLLELAQAMADPLERHYDAAEKLCRVVMDRAPVGSHEWKSAATTLADILVSVGAKPKEGLALLAMAQETKPILDLTAGWRTAEVKRQQLAIPEDGEIADQLKDLDWSEGLSFTMEKEDGRRIWVAKDLDLPASQQGKDLVLDLAATPDGTMAGSGTLWFNGKRIGNSWQWPDGHIVIPAAMQRYGGKNQFLALLQPTDFTDGAKVGRQAELATGKIARGKESAWARRGYREVPMAWYTSASCEEKGVNYTFYAGEWDGKALSDLDKLEVVRKGAVDSIGLLPRNQDKLFPKNVKGFVKLTGYVKAGAGLYDFSGTGWRVYTDSKKVIDDRRGKSTVYLGEGVHSFTLTHDAPSSMWGLDITLPADTFVRNTDSSTQRIMADALLMLGEDEKAREILLALKPDAWPIDEQTQLQLTADLQKCRQRDQKGGTDAGYGLQILDDWLKKHPMLRTDSEFMLTKLEVLAAAGDCASAMALAEPIARMDLSETQLEQFILVQVKAALKAGKMDAARDAYIKLKEVAPYGTATIEAREAITRAVIGE